MNSEEKKTTDLVPTDSYSLTTRPQTALEKVNELIEALPALAKRYEVLRRICLQNVVNHAGDWALWGSEKQGFKPRLNDGAAAKLLSFAGIRQEDARTWKEDLVLSDGKPKYVCWYSAKFISPLGGEYIALGSCASDDPFVASRYEWDDAAKRRVKKEIPASDVAYDNVVKAARANCLVNGVSALLGLKNVELEELAEMGVPVDQIESVGMTDKQWQPTEKQRGLALRLGATEAQIDACKTNKAFNELLEKIKAAKDVRKEAAKQEETAQNPDAPANATMLKSLEELAKKASIPMSEVHEFRRVCWGVKPESTITIKQATHITRWLQDPCPPEEYAAKAKAAANRAQEAPAGS